MRNVAGLKKCNTVVTGVQKVLVIKEKTIIKDKYNLLNRHFTNTD